MKKKETDALIAKIRAGDNEAWEILYGEYNKFIYSRISSLTKEYTIPFNKINELKADLYQAGWVGFCSALKTYDSTKGALTTLSSFYIDREMKRELAFFFNRLGLTEVPASERKITGLSPESQNPDALLEAKIENAISEQSRKGITLDPAMEGERYNVRRLVLQLLEVLRLLSDESHPLTKADLYNILKLYRTAKYQNSRMEKSSSTLSSAIKDILTEIPQIKYYETKEGEISNIYYSHPFKNEELDGLIQVIAFTDLLSLRDKERLIEKLSGTASLHYRSPFYDGERLRFDPAAVHGRFSSKTSKERRLLADNIKILQKAVRGLYQVRFTFNRYDSGGGLEPVLRCEHSGKSELGTRYEHNGKSEPGTRYEHSGKPEPGLRYEHSLSPYHLVSYHDNFYCIGLKNDDSRIWHYRVDLMTDIEIVCDKDGNPIPVKVSDFEGLPIGNSTWDPEKYMAEHLYMAYDEPREILIKIKGTSFTIIHDWFGDHYEKVTGDFALGKANEYFSPEKGYEVVKVKTSPSMIVHWAMQYGDAVEILDEDIRERIHKEIDSLRRLY